MLARVGILGLNYSVAEADEFDDFIGVDESESNHSNIIGN